MADRAGALIDLAIAISDGGPIHWPSEQSPDVTEAERLVLQQLRVIADVVALQQRLAPHAIHASVVDELRQDAPRAPDARETLPSWGPLKLIGLMGQGAFGEVYRAWDSRLDREVALKLLRRRESHRAAGSSLVDEGRLLAKVRHPNVITVYGAERIGDHAGIWMELVDGPTLAQLVAAGGPLPADEVARIGRDLCGAVTAVHRAGLLHRDIKGQNVMRDPDGRVVLMDFGAGREERTAAGSPRDMAGTPLYLAPEIFDGAGASAQSDIYSLGVLLYHLATGTYPVEASTVADIRDAHRLGRRRSLTDARPDLPSALSAAVERALSPRPGARFGSAASMAAALAASEPVPVRPSRGKYLIAASVVASGALIALAVLAAWRSAPPPATSGLVIRRVADHTPIDGSSGLSRDGRYVTHVDSAKSGNLVLTDLTTGRTRSLSGRTPEADPNATAEFSAFSPDDKQIAYVWLTTSGSDVRIVGVDGSTSRVLYHDDKAVYVPWVGWSPDGTTLLAIVKRPDGVHDMVLLAVAGGSPRTIRTLDRRAPGKPCFSPDGRYVAYDLPQRESTPGRDIFTLALDSGREEPLVQHPANDFVIGWMSDGRRLLFGSDRSGTIGGWSIPVLDGRAAGAPELFRPDMGSGWPMRLTPAGSYYYAVPVSTNDIYTATLDTALGTVVAPPAQIAQPFAGTNRWPEWSPDGRQIAYVSQVRSGAGGQAAPALVIESAAGGARRQLTPRLTFFSRLRWSPDGAAFLANGRDEQNRGGLFWIDARSGESTMLASSQGMPRQSAWLRDGKAVLYWDAAAGPDAPIVKRDLQSGAEHPVFRGGDFALSPDNRWLTVALEAPQTASSVLRLIPMGEGVARDLMEGGPGVFNLGCAWAPDSRRGLCIKAPEQGSTELWRFSIDGSPPVRLLAMDRMSALRINPDGRRIAFSVEKGATELWVMENLLPAPATRRP